MSSDKLRKAKLRLEYKSLRDDLPEEERVEAQNKISQNICNLLKKLKAKSVASYKQLGSEVAVDLNSKDASFSICYPRVEKEHLKFYCPSNENSFQQGNFRILEPVIEESQEISLNEVDAVLVPGLVFDRMGQRLGYGRGFYDRALASYSGFKIGIVFNKQITEEHIPSEDHDLSMDFLVTEDFIASFPAA